VAKTKKKPAKDRRTSWPKEREINEFKCSYRDENACSDHKLISESDKRRE